MTKESITTLASAYRNFKGPWMHLGDVSPILFTIALLNEVDEYCNKLIQEVGKDGGFYLKQRICFTIQCKA